MVSSGAEGGIVSEGVAQVLDGLGNPRSHCGLSLAGSLPLFVSLPRILPSFAGQANTYLTPAKAHPPPGTPKNDPFQIHVGTHPVGAPIF